MANYDYIYGTGIIVPDTSTVQAEVEAEYKEVYGDDFVIDSSSEQGREIDAEVTSRMSVLRNNAKLANQINPNMAEENFLDAIYALSGGERNPATRSTVPLTLGGVDGTIIPSGSVATDENGEDWETTFDVTIGSSGSITVDAYSVNYGVIQAAIGEINTVSSGGVLGWETVTNEVAATPGSVVQSDVLTRSQRKVELGLNARNNALAIIASISDVEGVGSLTYRENYESTSQTIDGVTLDPNSTYVCVDGGVGDEIAEAYYDARSGGSAFTGDITYTVTDPNSLQDITVKFARPEDKPKYVRVTVKSLSGSISSTEIKQAVVDYADGLLSDEEGFTVGGDVSSFEIAAAVNSQVTGTFVYKVEIAENDGGTPVWTTDTITTEIYQKASVTTDNVSVVVI